MFVCAECGASQPTAGTCLNDGQPLQSVGEDLLLGQTVGAYRVARLLGIGGMGRVYKGVHPTIGSRVAIKVLSRECSDRRDLVERFFAEAKAVNLIRHESIVNILDLSTLPDGRPFIVMEYLDGAPLASLIEEAQRQGPLPLGGIARLAAEVLDALGAAHAKGIVHRDLKPDNIFVTPAGRAKVLDFGIAKLQPELGGSATHTGSLLGTPHYMSPEQASGRSVDLRADIYAIGVILFELATLRKPFVASSLFDLLRMHVETPPPSPRALRPDMPEALEHVIYTALAKQPEHRFASTAAMSAALQHATAQLPQEQWAVLSGARSRASSAGGWSPTPPASWARPHAPQQPTPSIPAGQIATTPPPGGGRKALWAVLVLVLVGGGVTAGVLATRHAQQDGSSGSGTSAASAGSAGSAVVVAEVPPQPEPPPTTTPPAPAKEDTEPPEPPEAPDSEDTTDIDGQIDSVLAEMPPEALAQMPQFSKALKKYGSFAKIPKRERQKLLGEITGAAGLAAAQAGAQVNSALAGHASPASQDWLDDRTLSPPGWDPKHVNVDAFIAFGITEAKHSVPDAQLWWISIDGVHSDGHADLTLPAFAGNAGSLDMRFYSPSHAKRDPSIPRGVPQKLQCEFRVDADPDNVALHLVGFGDCKEKTIPKPRCSVAQVWKKALQARKDLAGAVASITYTANIVTHKIVWMFDVRDPDAPYSEQFPDDC